MSRVLLAPLLTAALLFTPATPAAVAVTGLANVRQVAAGQDSTLAVRYVPPVIIP